MTRARAESHFTAGLVAWVVLLTALITARFQGYIATPWPIVLAPIWLPAATMAGLRIVWLMLLWYAYIIWLVLS